uniref:50S ribosomal protein L35 n=1 Tax=Amphora coffeiformis TaxID=265554 RepID=A0A7S3P505_9STRA|mmetsp:Transcript_18129/g.34635  ORF Transcript_18129/g.34635 Transcript_18129/m.34635 type:complete len:122 (+) Transcript_18129:62-427(+)
MFGFLARQSRTLLGGRFPSVPTIKFPPRVVADGLWGTLWQQQQQLLQQQTLLTIRSKHTNKTIKGVAKRFRARGNGTLKRAKAGRQHNTGHKDRARKNQLGQSTTIKDKRHHQKMKMCMGI